MTYIIVKSDIYLILLTTPQGKSLFMPLRVLLTGKLHGPDMGESLLLIYKAGKCDAVAAHQSGFVPLEERFKMLRELDWELLDTGNNPSKESATATAGAGLT